MTAALDRALINLVCSHVFQASIIMRLRRIEDSSMPFPMGTDGIRLLVNPTLCEAYSEAELTGILAHEAMHVAGRHPLRREAREAMQWNVACDAVVNAQVGESKLALPKDGVPAIPDETPEHLYEVPPDALKEAMASAKRWDELMDPTGEGGRPLTRAERSALDQETRQWVEAAAEAAKRAGQLPAGLERWVKRELRSVVPWREVLARFVCEKRATDYAWDRPNQRFVPFGVWLPRLRANDVPNVVVACDTSGSMSQRLIAGVVAELVAILDLMSGTATVEVPVLWFDADVYPQTVTDESELTPKGGGGTDYAPVMEWMRESGGEAAGLVVVTDGYCDSWGAKPPCDVLWVLTNEHNEQFAPPWGEVALVLPEST